MGIAGKYKSVANIELAAARNTGSAKRKIARVIGLPRPTRPGNKKKAPR
jgi:hypothetical protein